MPNCSVASEIGDELSAKKGVIPFPSRAQPRSPVITIVKVSRPLIAPVRDLGLMFQGCNVVRKVGLGIASSSVRTPSRPSTAGKPAFRPEGFDDAPSPIRAAVVYNHQLPSNW